MALGWALFITGTLGFGILAQNTIARMFSIELMLLGGALIVITASLQHADIAGTAFGLLTICSAGAESVIGLGILVSFYRLRGDLGQST